MTTQRAFANQISCIGVFATVCVLALVLLGGCAQGNENESNSKVTLLNSELTPNPTPGASSNPTPSQEHFNSVSAGESMTPEQADALADFSIRLVQALSDEEGNLLVSPLSLAYALGMLENGASAETLAQLEAVIGISAEELQEIYASFPRSENISVANALWVRDDCPVDPQFLEDSRVLYEAEVFNAPFDEKALRQINEWADEKTDGMIPSVLNELPQSAVMVLLDAITFKAKWAIPSDAAFTFKSGFVTASGEEQTAHYMSFEEPYYIETDYATGFIKSYEGGDYEFVALLPNEGYDPRGIICDMSGTELRNIITHTEYIPVRTIMPRFSTELELNLNEPLQSMGVHAAFSGQEGFDRILSTDREDANPLDLGSVSQNTFIEVDEYGTRAAAVTVELLCGSAEIDDYREVTLNKPFAYMIVEAETHVPIFVGVLESVA